MATLTTSVVPAPLGSSNHVFSARDRSLEEPSEAGITVYRNVWAQIFIIIWMRELPGAGISAPAWFQKSCGANTHKKYSYRS
jgi:hypothetical protein